MKMDNPSEYCSPGCEFKEEMIAVSHNVSLRVIKFTPKKKNNNPTIVFIPGWISMISGWKKALLEMTKDFPVYYVETREKISSCTNGKVEYSVKSFGQDIVSIASHFNLKSQNYILFGSSLGATAILDCCRFLEKAPLCLILIAPNAVFRVPNFWMGIVRIFPPRLYLIFKPVIKWYLKNFRLDIESDYAQYKKYCNALDTADPWKLKKAMISLSKYEVWDLLGEIEFPTLIVGASKDEIHEPENMKKMVSKIKYSSYLDLETNTITHSEVVVKEMRKYISKLGRTKKN
ncbi:MAG: alpha/beta hydrolase [Candidatus Marinimicrobia bacterium]|nr:alpha/beta hydrolase [Candidatus Neomarinimicrobiota bacterium]